MLKTRVISLTGGFISKSKKNDGIVNQPPAKSLLFRSISS